MRSRQSAFLILALGALICVVLSFVLARNATRMFEKATRVAVERSLHASGQNWVTSEINGTHVNLSGRAPNAVAQERAYRVVASAVSEYRINDATTLPGPQALPTSAAKLILMPYDSDGISLSGIVPRAFHADVIAALRQAGFSPTEDLAIKRDWPISPDWNSRLAAAARLARAIPIGTVSLSSAGDIEIDLPPALRHDAKLIDLLRGLQGERPFHIKAAMVPLDPEIEGILEQTLASEAREPAAPAPVITQDPVMANYSVLAYRLGDGHLHVRAHVPALSAKLAAPYANALFGDNVTLSLTPDPDLPENAALLTALDVMDMLQTGYVSITPQEARVAGAGIGDAIDTDARALLTGRMPQDVPVMVSVRSLPLEPEPLSSATPDSCNALFDTALAEQSVLFAPSSAVISEESAPLLDHIARIMRSCDGLIFEIGGHTDDRGSDQINRAISQARADSVVDALLARGIFLNRMQARGFGESFPIADNETEDGREKNRRIEIKAMPTDPARAEQAPALTETAPEDS